MQYLTTDEPINILSGNLPREAWAQALVEVLVVSIVR
jgi:hypothetical protein